VRGRAPDEAAGRSGDEAALGDLLARASALRAAGQVPEALACGPDILRAYFRAERGRALDRGHPRTFTEKLFCRMLEVHERGCAAYTRLADKLAVRPHVAQVIGERYLTPLLWHGDDGRAIPWSRLPRQAVLKCNEGSRKGCLIEAPYDPASLLQEALRWQAQSHYWGRREFHYWPMPRHLMIEERLDDGHPDGPLDYIFFCFDGVPRLVQIGSRSHTIHRFFTPSWEPVALTYRLEYEAPPIPRPVCLDEMLDVAARLSEGFDFVRVDLYDTQGGVRFGELTFTPTAGKAVFEPPEWDDRLGDCWCYRGIPS
jgi:hypothetical protein